jgi:hypothetical protein
MTTPMTSSTADAGPARPSAAAVRAGWVLSGLEIVFLLFDSVTKVLKLPQVVAATVALGFPENTVRAIGILLLIGIVLYAIPRTSFFGAVFVTAYLGGAVCANVRAEMPMVGYVLSPVYTAIALWVALYLRSAALRQLVRTGY